MIKYLLFACVCLLAACTPAPTHNAPKIFFDLQAFAKNQTKILTQTHPKATKIVRLGQRTDTLRQTTINWQQALDIIADTDLNKPAFATQYTTKTTQNTTEYTAKSPELTTQKIIITTQKTQPQPTQIEIHTRASNALYTSTKKILYTPTKTLEVSGSQQLFYGKKTDFYTKIIL